MALHLPASRLLPVTHACYFLSGEDDDGVFETAEALLADAADGATLLRVDINELALIHENMQPGLFGEVRVHAMVRNAASASPKQIDRLETLAAHPPSGLRLVICAAGADSKKAVYKRISALPETVCCTLDRMDEAAFTPWLAQIATEAGLQLSDEAVAMMASHLSGMRMAARQAVARLRLYAGDEQGALGVDVIGELLGERSPADLVDLCHAVGERSPRAIGLLRNLLREQQVAETQVLSWLSMRLQQLLLYAWYATRDRRNASRQAGLFGDARRLVPKEAVSWKPAELMHAMVRLLDVEMQLKGASAEGKGIVLERFVLGLLAG